MADEGGSALWKPLLILLVLAWPAAAQQQRVPLDGRYYLIDLPDHPTGAMILALHGAGGNPALFARVAGLSAPAMAQGYAVIYPAGSGQNGQLTWNAGYCCGYAQSAAVDDIGFLDQVVADAAGRFSLDATRVYLNGMSNGAMLAETYAVRRAGPVRAVAGVSGTLDIAATRPVAVPLLHIHGTADQVVPYAGGTSTSGTVRFTGVADEVAAFLAVDGALTRTSRVIDPADDGMSVTEDDYTDRNGHTRLRLMTVQGGRHVWPGQSGPQAKFSTRDIVASAEVLRFFAEHP